MTVKDIVEKYLKDNGFDGLCGDDCGCGLDCLAPCDCDFFTCQPAYKQNCAGEKCSNQCDAYEGDCRITCYSTAKPEAHA